VRDHVAHDTDKAAAAPTCSRGTALLLEPGYTPIMHPHLRFSAQAAAFRLAHPFTGHPMFGHDIIYTHPLNHGAALGRCAQRDFLSFADASATLMAVCTSRSARR